MKTIYIIKNSIFHLSVTTNSDECKSVEWRLAPFEVVGNILKNIEDIV